MLINYYCSFILANFDNTGKVEIHNSVLTYIIYGQRIMKLKLENVSRRKEHLKDADPHLHYIINSY